MADNKVSGGLPGDEKNRGNGEKAGEVKKENNALPQSDKRNSARLNAKRRIQRKKFSATLEKNNMTGKAEPEKSGMVRKPEPKKETPKLPPREEARIREDIHPRPAIPEIPPAEVREKQVSPDDSKASRGDQTSITYFSHAFTPAGDETDAKPEAVEPASAKRVAVEPTFTEPSVPEPMPVEPKKEDILPGTQVEEPQGGERKVEETQVEEEKPATVSEVTSVPAEIETEATPLEEEALRMPEPEVEPVGQEEEIVIGKTESAPHIPVGQISESEPVHPPIHTETMEDVNEEAEIGETVSGEDNGREVMNREELKKKGLEKDQTEHLIEKESTGRVLKSWLLMNWPKITASTGRFFGGFGQKMKGSLSGLNFGRVFSCFLLIVLLGGGYYGYTIKLHEKAYSYIAGFFEQKPVEKVEVTLNLQDQRVFGITESAIFGSNSGSVNDLIPAQIRMAVFFGELMEPKVQGETGITALTFYGELKDGAATVNEFVVYMQNLADVQNLYKTDVYAMLDKSTARDKVLLDYQDKLKQARDKSQVLHDQIVVNMDDFTQSYNSLTPDKNKYEQDFFTAMGNLESEKSDLLLKGFIDISQKQIALKARVSALTKLEGYYTSALQKLDIRIRAVEQNRDALIQGIKVVDIPGSDLNIIIKSS